MPALIPTIVTQTGIMSKMDMFGTIKLMCISFVVFGTYQINTYSYMKEHVHMYINICTHIVTPT